LSITVVIFGKVFTDQTLKERTLRLVCSLIDRGFGVLILEACFMLSGWVTWMIYTDEIFQRLVDDAVTVITGVGIESRDSRY